MAIFKQVWLRGAKKRLGGAVTYTMNGQQIARELAANVKNPRTSQQMRQRVKLASLVNFYRSMRTWAKIGAFSNKPTTWSDYNAFVSANIGSQPVYLTKTQASAGCAIVAPYIISRGVLPLVTTEYSSSFTSFVSNIYVGELEPTGDNVTLGALSLAIIGNNNGVLNGDQISIISVIQRTSNTGPYIIQRAYEFTLDTGSTSTMEELGIDTFLNEVSQGDGFSLSHPAEENNMACAFVISRKVGGRILTGDAQLVLTPTAKSFLRVYQSSAQLQLAIASYGQGEDNFLDPTTTGGSSNNAVLNTQILSVTFTGTWGSAEITAGDTLSSIRGQVGDIYVNTSSPVEPGDVDQFVFRNASDTAIVVLTQTPVIETGRLRYTLEAQQMTDLMSNINNIRSAALNAGDESVSIQFGNNGGQADPGDVTG